MHPEEILPLFRALEEEGVDYVLVGGVAMGLQGLARATQDVDLFVRPVADNIHRLRRALRRVYQDDSVEEILVEDLAGDYPVVRYGPPEVDYLVDLLGRLGEVWNYEDLEWEWIETGGTRVRVATPRTLHRMKKDTVRPRDRMDAEVLRQRFGLGDED